MMRARFACCCGELRTHRQTATPFDEFHALVRMQRDGWAIAID